MTKNKINAVLLSIFCVSALSIYTIGCADDPSSLGLNFIPPGETTGVRIFDSYIDTMPISSENRLYYVNTSGSSNLMVGKSGTFETKGALRFDNLNPDYDSATVVSAVITLRYRNYYYPTTTSDSLGQIAFDIFEVEQNFDYTTVTMDSINSSSFGTTPRGTFTGSPTADSQEVAINLDPLLVRDWLEYAADSSYSNKNYGIVFSPTNASNVIKAFYSSSSVEGARPSLQIIVTKNNDTDTLNFNSSSSVSLTTGSLTPSAETFSMQAGISYVQVMKFDMSYFPASATINDVQLYLTLDSVNSNFSNQTNFRVNSQFITDSAGLVTESFSFAGTPTGEGKYAVALMNVQAPSPFQRWQLGQANYGILLFAGNQTINLDRYVFYKETASDPANRPRVVIKYTPRVTP